MKPALPRGRPPAQSVAVRWPSWLLRGQCGHGQSARDAASTRSVCSYCMTPPDAHRTPAPNARTRPVAQRATQSGAQTSPSISRELFRRPIATHLSAKPAQVPSQSPARCIYTHVCTTSPSLRRCVPLRATTDASPRKRKQTTRKGATLRRAPRAPLAALRSTLSHSQHFWTPIYPQRR